MSKKPPDKILQAIELKNRNPEITMKEAGKIAGCSDAYISAQFKKLGLDWKKTQTFKQLKADILAAHQDKILSAISEEDLKKASLKDKAISFGVFSDKEELVRNKTAVKELMSDVIEKMSKNRRTTITIEQTDDISVNNVSNNTIEAECIVEA